MRKTREMPAEIVLPGHGEPIIDHVALIDDRIAKHERRKEKIYKLIAEQPRSGYELAQAIWGNVAVTQAFLTLSEVIGHADLLVNEGRVREADDGDGDPLRGDLEGAAEGMAKSGAGQSQHDAEHDVGDGDPGFARLADPLGLHHPGREGRGRSRAGRRRGSKRPSPSTEAPASEAEQDGTAEVDEEASPAGKCGCNRSATNSVSPKRASAPQPPRIPTPTQTARLTSSPPAARRRSPPNSGQAGGEADRPIEDGEPQPAGVDHLHQLQLDGREGRRERRRSRWSEAAAGSSCATGS